MTRITRKGKTYCYRSRRVNGRIVKEYVGNSAEAIEAAAFDAFLRENKREIRAYEKLLAGIDEIANSSAEAAMLIAGFHMPKRDIWRKKRASH